MLSHKKKKNKTQTVYIVQKNECNDSKRNCKHCIQISEVKEGEDLFKMLKLQHFGHWMQRVDSLEKTLNAGKEWGQEEKRTTEDEMVG